MDVLLKPLWQPPKLISTLSQLPSFLTAVEASQLEVNWDVFSEQFQLIYLAKYGECLSLEGVLLSEARLRLRSNSYRDSKISDIPSFAINLKFNIARKTFLIFVVHS